MSLTSPAFSGSPGTSLVAWREFSRFWKCDEGQWGFQARRSYLTAVTRKLDSPCCSISTGAIGRKQGDR